MNTFTAVNPGTRTIHNTLLRFSQDTIIIEMDNVDANVVDELLARQPVNLAHGPRACLQRCGELSASG